MADVAVVGSLALDRVNGGPPRPGGCPLFAGQALRAVGVEGQILTRCGDADRAFFEKALAGLGVPTTILSGRRTPGFEHAYEGEVRSTTVTALGDAWTPADAAHVDPGATWAHLAPLLRSDFPPDTVAAFAAGGRRVSLDAQGLVRVPELGPLVQDERFDPAVLGPVSVLKLSEEEAAIVAGGRRFGAEAVRALGVPEILVTRGSRGADVWVGEEVTHVPGKPVAGVEATGAGDAFVVAYVSARHGGAAPVEAARTGAAVVARMLSSRKRRR